MLIDSSTKHNLRYYLLILAILCGALFFFLKFKSVSAEITDAAHHGLSRGDVETIVKEVINSNPELIVTSVRKWNMEQEKEALSEVQKRISAQRERIEGNPNDPRVGSAQGVVKIVEMFDYSCGYCRRMLPIEEKILANNPDVTIIYKPFPILGEGSVLATKAALAAYALDPTKFMKMHESLFNQKGERTQESILDLAGAAGYNIEAFRAKLADASINQIIDETRSVASAVGISSTPTFIINGSLVAGSISFEELNSKVDALRKEAAKHPAAAKEVAKPSNDVAPSAANTEVAKHSEGEAK